MNEFKPVYLTEAKESDSNRLRAPDYFLCETCGEHIKPGIANIAEHWNNCKGKGFKEYLIACRKEIVRGLKRHNIVFLRKTNKPL